jgi:hypothetical protein
MIQIPSIGGSSGQRYFADSVDPDVWYLDSLAPAPVGQKKAVRWMPLPDAAYLAGEVRFGPGGDDPEPRTNMPRRLLPVPWDIAPVYAWYRDGDRARIIAQGKTSGFSASNAVFSGTAPLGAMVSSIVIAAELSCDVQLAVSPSMRVTGTGRVDALQDSFRRIESGAEWDATIGAVLIAMLAGAIGSAALQLNVDAGGSGGDELRDAALCEWAHRILAVIAPDVTLAFPASLISAMRLEAPPTLDLHWASGDRFRLRTVKSLQANG